MAHQLTNPIIIDAKIRGGGIGGGAWIARLTGPDATYDFAREFLSKGGQRSRSGRSGQILWTITEPGLYELRGVQYAKGEATVGELDSGFMMVDEAGGASRITREQAVELVRAGEV